VKPSEKLMSSLSSKIIVLPGLLGIIISGKFLILIVSG